MTTLSAVMSHVRGDISLVIRIATITEIFGHVLGIFWAYPGHILGIRNGQTGFVLVLVMVLQCDGIRFFHAPGLLRPFWSSKRVTVKRKHVHKCQVRSRHLGRYLLLMLTLQGNSPERDEIRFFRAPGLMRPFWSSKGVTVKRRHVHKCENE